MTNDTLSHILRSIDLNQCCHTEYDGIYYIEKHVTQRVNDHFFREKYEFIILAPNREKQAIILRCGFADLHWYVFRKYRGQHVLSNALRTGVIKELWPENKRITCHYCYDDPKSKYDLTCHLADLAGLKVEE